MKKFISRIRAPKFLRFVYYSLYSYALRTDNSTPKFSTDITMAFTHGIQSFFFIHLFHYFFQIDLWDILFSSTGKSGFVIATILFLGLIIIIYSYKGKHLAYIEEFESSSTANRKSNAIFLYVAASFTLLIGGFCLIVLSR